jgi:hypothetical protein
MENYDIVKMGYVIQNFLLTEKLINVKPKELMPLLIEKGFFNQDHKEGLPLRNLLRELNFRNELYLIPQVRADHKEKNIYWFFNPYIV